MAKIGYARVSTKAQKLDMQIDALKKAGCERIFSEFVSTAKEKRHEFLACLDYLRNGDELYLYSLCRLARNHDEILKVKKELDDKGVIIRSLEFNIDTSTPQGEMFFQFYAAILEFQRRWISEKTQDGLRAARARGRYGGRRPKLNNKQMQMLADMYASKKYTYEEMAEAFKISKVSVWTLANKHLEKQKMV